MGLPIKPELSRPYAVERLPADGARFAFQASEAERAALARRFDLAALDRLEASGTVLPSPRRAGAVEVEGRLLGELSQRCVVTFEPVPERVDVAFRRVFAPEAAEDAGAGAGGEVDLELDPDGPEPLPAGGVLDVGELVAEEMAVALDPHPRSPSADAVLAEHAPPPAPGGGDEGARPFAALAGLRAPPRRH
jgi:uncharacterized metal-binding protein YceD (DUF177 family)